MKKMIKKILVFMLAFCMTASTFSMPVFAASDNFKKTTKVKYGDTTYYTKMHLISTGEVRFNLIKKKNGKSEIIAKSLYSEKFYSNGKLLTCIENGKLLGINLATGKKRTIHDFKGDDYTIINASYKKYLYVLYGWSLYAVNTVNGNAVRLCGAYGGQIPMAVFKGNVYAFGATGSNLGDKTPRILHRFSADGKKLASVKKIGNTKLNAICDVAAYRNNLYITRTKLTDEGLLYRVYKTDAGLTKLTPVTSWAENYPEKYFGDGAVLHR